MKTWQMVLIGVFGGLIGAALILIVNSPPRGQGIEIIPPPTPGPAIVHVTGAVQQPGVYKIDKDLRVQDAITAAGGLQPNAAAEKINLAAKIHDGGQIFVPTQCVGQDCALLAIENAQKTASLSAPININTADVQTISTLPAIGPSKAEAIVAYRDEHGFYTSLKDIEDVPGIGAGIIEQIKDWVVFE